MKQRSEKSNRKIRLWVEDSKPHFGYFCEDSIFNSWRTSAKSKQQLNKWHSYATFSPLGEKPVFPSSSIWDITVLVFFNTLRDLCHLTDYLCSKTQSFTDTILNFCLATQLANTAVGQPSFISQLVTSCSRKRQDVMVCKLLLFNRVKVGVCCL